jgi:hypothetical protein
VHTCKLRRCLFPDKHGFFTCKRRAPFRCASDDFVDENGDWGPKRLYAYINGWIPGITICLRCNNDGKLLTNGGDNKNITFYVTSYTAKKQGRNFNLSAIMEKVFIYDREHANSTKFEDIRDRQRLLIFRTINTINREQELAAPMVISYLMGWGNVYRSHHYSPIYWSTFTSSLFKAFPELKSSGSYV